MEFNPRSMTRRAYYSLTVLILSFLQGCATYRPAPLDHAAVRESLSPPSMERVRVLAMEIQHPILKPLTIDDRNGLSPDEAAVVAVLANPMLRAVRDKRGVAAAQLIQAGLLPNPQLGYTIDVPAAGPTGGTVRAFGLTLNWDVASLITKSAAIDAARAEALSVDLDVAWQEWQVAQSAKKQIYRLISFQQQLDVAREEEKGLRENVEAVKKAVDFRDMTVIDLSAAEAALKAVQLSLLALEQQNEQERLALNRSLGAPPDRIIPLERQIAPPQPELLPSVDRIVEGIEEHRLDLLALRMGYQSQEARLRAAILSQFPKINIGFSRSRDTAHLVTAGFGVTIDLPFFDRNQGRIAVERATRKQLFDEYAARLFEAGSNAASISADIGSVQRQIDATEASVKTLKRLVQTYYKAFLEGNADAVSYYRALNDSIAKQMDLFSLKRNLADLIVAMEIVAGRYLGEMSEGKEASE